MLTVAMFSHDSVGLGHARRNRALAHSLADQLPDLVGQPVRGVLIAGHPEVARDTLPDGWDWLVLPGVTPGPGGHQPRHLAGSLGQLAELRGAVIDAALTELAPDLFLVDRHPFGVAGELSDTLARLRRRGTRTVLGLREVLDDPAVTSREWAAVGGPGRVAAAYDAVWIYGDPSVYDPRLSGEVPGALARIATATGYLAVGRPEATPVAGDLPEVLTLLGGGSDGADLASIAAAAPPPAGHRHVVVTGPQMPASQVVRVRAAAAAGVEVHQRVDQLPGRIAAACAVVCMGGYNTVTEVLATTTPTLVVPRAERRTEQRRRATALAAAGLVETIELAELTTTDVTDFFARSVGHRFARDAVDLAGLSRVPHLAAALLDRPAIHPHHREAFHAV